MTQQMQLEQATPTLINKRPFFSVVVPCYNSRKTIGRLLNSLVLQNLEFNDLQVVLSDDCSTESYQDVIDKYKQLLNIKQVSTDYNYCPGNTRQRGIDNADGEWIIFSDHDDEFFPDCFGKVKQAIIENNFNQIVFTPFYKRQLDGQLVQMPSNAGWTHGKFFNLDNFWKKYNLHYIKDLYSHEDVCLCTQLDFLRCVLKLDYYIVTVPCYIWNEVATSITNKKYIEQSKEREFLDAFYVDYIESTAGTAMMMYNQNEKTQASIKWTKEQLIKVILYGYFYFEYDKFIVPQYMTKNCDCAKKYLNILKDQFNTSVEDVYNFFRTEHPDEYPIIFEMAVGQTAEFIYEKSFKEWLYWIWDNKY